MLPILLLVAAPSLPPMICEGRSGTNLVAARFEGEEFSFFVADVDPAPNFHLGGYLPRGRHKLRALPTGTAVSGAIELSHFVSEAPQGRGQLLLLFTLLRGGPQRTDEDRAIALKALEALRAEEGQDTAYTAPRATGKDREAAAPTGRVAPPASPIAGFRLTTHVSPSYATADVISFSGRCFASNAESRRLAARVVAECHRRYLQQVEGSIDLTKDLQQVFLDEGSRPPLKAAAPSAPDVKERVRQLCGE